MSVVISKLFNVTNDIAIKVTSIVLFIAIVLYSLDDVFFLLTITYTKIKILLTTVLGLII